MGPKLGHMFYTALPFVFWSQQLTYGDPNPVRSGRDKHISIGAQQNAVRLVADFRPTNGRCALCARNPSHRHRALVFSWLGGLWEAGIKSGVQFFSHILNMD